MKLNVNEKHLRKLITGVTAEKLKAEVSELSFVGGGSFGKVYKVITNDGRKIAVKAFREKGDQQKESNQLILLSGNTHVSMPEVLFLYDDGESALMGMTFIEGRNVLNPLFVLKSRAQKKKLADDVVSAMLEWHSVKGEKYGDSENPQYESWKEYYINEKQKPWLKGLEALADKGKYGKKNLEMLKAATGIYNSLPEEAEAPVLIHGDLNIMNIMADPKNS